MVRHTDVPTPTEGRCESANRKLIRTLAPVIGGRESNRTGRSIGLPS